MRRLVRFGHGCRLSELSGWRLGGRSDGLVLVSARMEETARATNFGPQTYRRARGSDGALWRVGCHQAFEHFRESGGIMDDSSSEHFRESEGIMDDSSSEHFRESGGIMDDPSSIARWRHHRPPAPSGKAPKQDPRRGKWPRCRRTAARLSSSRSCGNFWSCRTDTGARCPCPRTSSGAVSSTYSSESPERPAAQSPAPPNVQRRSLQHLNSTLQHLNSPDRCHAAGHLVRSTTNVIEVRDSMSSGGFHTREMCKMSPHAIRMIPPIGGNTSRQQSSPIRLSHISGEGPTSS